MNIRNISFLFLLLLGINNRALGKNTLAQTPEEFVALFFNSETSRGDKKILNVSQLIAKQDIQALGALSKEDLSFEDENTIFVDGRFFDPSGMYTDAMFGTENAFGVVLYHSTTNTTEKDNAATLEMLNLLIDKGLDLNTKTAFGFFVKDNPEDTFAKDYVTPYFSLVDLAIQSNAPANIVELLLEKGVKYDSRVARNASDEVAQVLEKYKHLEVD